VDLSRWRPKGFFQGVPTVVKFHFTNSKTMRKTFFYQKVNSKISNFKIQDEAKPPHHSHRAKRTSCISRSESESHDQHEGAARSRRP